MAVDFTAAARRCGVGVTDYTDLRSDLVRIGDNFMRVTDAQGQFNDVTNQSFKEVWDQVGELRDEILALSNRIETLTRATLTEPSEVAAKIVTDANRQTLREVRDDG